MISENGENKIGIHNQHLNTTECVDTSMRTVVRLSNVRLPLSLQTSLNELRWIVQQHLYFT